MKASKARTLLSAIWLIFTFSLVSWWFVLNLRSAQAPEQVPEDSAAAESTQRGRMYFWEGSTLLLTVLLGGGLLIGMSRREDQRNESLRFFFANFSHDIKTSISRLRLQAEILAEELSNSKDGAENKVLKRLLADVSRLDLQLENSLLLSHESEFKLLLQDLEIQPLIHSLQIEFHDLTIVLSGNARIKADSRAIKSILRNLIENARHHGQATTVKITSATLSDSKILIRIEDNGSGSSLALDTLGKEITPQTASTSNGIGLFLCRQLIQKMKGTIRFMPGTERGLICELTLPGASV